MAIFNSYVSSPEGISHKVSTKSLSSNQRGRLVASCNWWLKTSCSFSPPESPPLIGAASECLPMISLIQTSLRKSPGSGMPFSKKRLAIEGPQCLRLPCKSARHNYVSVCTRTHPSWNSVSSQDPCIFFSEGCLGSTRKFPKSHGTHCEKKHSPDTVNPKYLSVVEPKERELRGHKLQKTAPCLKREESRFQLCIYVHITPQALHLQTFWIYLGFNAWSFWTMIHWCVIFAALMISTVMFDWFISAG